MLCKSVLESSKKKKSYAKTVKSLGRVTEIISKLVVDDENELDIMLHEVYNQQPEEKKKDFVLAVGWPYNRPYLEQFCEEDWCTEYMLKVVKHLEKTYSEDMVEFCDFLQLLLDKSNNSKAVAKREADEEDRLAKLLTTPNELMDLVRSGLKSYHDYGAFKTYFNTDEKQYKGEVIRHLELVLEAKEIPFVKKNEVITKILSELQEALDNNFPGDKKVLEKAIAHIKKMTGV